MEQLLTDEQIGKHTNELNKETFTTEYLKGFSDGAKWARQQIMEKLSGMKVYLLYCYPDSMQDFFGVFFSKNDAQDAVKGNGEWKGDNKDYYEDENGCSYDIEEIPLNPESIYKNEE